MFIAGIFLGLVFCFVSVYFCDYCMEYGGFLRLEIVPVYGFENTYSISNRGEVFRTRKQVLKQLKAHVSRGDGYARVMLSKNNKKFVMLVHRMVLESFVGPSQNKECCHYDGDRSNNCLDNLRWGTRLENQQDRLRHGTLSVNKRENNPMARLNQNKAEQIKKLLSFGLSQRAVAKKFDVSQATIHKIHKGITWASTTT